ncbi:MAG TPA: hypothetical protein PKJ41_16560, partial [Bryobacteraceae bacterium]|nr:hypothetical protein [Bryobacteraceae bacterium]
GKARLEAAGRDNLLREKNEQLLAKSEAIIKKTETIADLRNEITEARQENIEQITGGTSYCYADFHPTEDGTARVAVVHSGPFPLYDVQMQIVDLQRFDKLAPGPSSLGRFMEAQYTIDLGNLSAGAAMLRSEKIRFSGSDQQDFNISFVARNGNWNQLVRLRQVDGRWVAATRVVRRKGKDTKVIYEKVEGKFPRAVGSGVTW